MSESVPHPREPNEPTRVERERKCIAENWAIRARNEFKCSVRPFFTTFSELPPVEQNDLDQAEAFFRHTNDWLHLIKLKLKSSEPVDEELAALAANPDLTPLTRWLAPQRIAEMEQANLAQLAYAYARYDQAKRLRTVPNEREALIGLFRTYAEGRNGDTLADHELAATGYWEALKLAKRHTAPSVVSELSHQAIAHFAAAADNRAAVGDLWWEGIARRELAKISQSPEDLAIAKDFANRLIEKLDGEGQYLKASYWVRDLQDLEPSSEHFAATQERWMQTIERARTEGNLRTESRAYWQWYKRLASFAPEDPDVERYRHLAIDGYRTLRDVPNQRPEFVREAHIMLTELIQ